MLTCINSLWAKKDEKNGRFFWLPLMVHLEDTMNVAGWLWNHWLSDGQREYLTGQMQSASGKDVADEEAENLVRFLGGIHDLGKATPVFQIKKSYSASRDLDLQIAEQLEQAGFSGISSCHLSHPEKTPHALAGEVILHAYGYRDDIASIVGAHHGKPISSTEVYESQKSAYSANYYQSDIDGNDFAAKWIQVRKEILHWAETTTEIDAERVPEISQPAQVILSGLLIMADWIASNTSYFPLYPMEALSGEINPDEEERFTAGMSKWFRNLPFQVDEVDDAEGLYQKRFGFSPRQFQKEIFQTIQQIQNPGIVVIEAPMGSGKTEAALAAAEQLAAKTGRSGLFFGLPTQATSNGIFRRIEDWTESVAADYGDTSIRLVHGKAALNHDMILLREKSLGSGNNIDTDEDSDGTKEGTVSVNEWFSGRKTTTLDDFVVGTVDQFLLMALQQKHLALRHLGFSKKVIVIDEVHAYDVYMQQYLKEAVRWAGAYHVPVVLLSATLPSATRNDLIFEYLKGRGFRKKDILAQEEQLARDRYPLVTYSDGEKIYQNVDLSYGDHKEVQVIRMQESDLYQQIQDLICDGGVVGIIVNTVRRAQEIAENCREIFTPDIVELLHANFIATDRIRKEETLLHSIGKGAERPAKKIIIGTQVLEQSLDIDFDVLITDLCPMDLLIQRIGRLHRHEIPRPDAHRFPTVYVMGTSENWEFESGAKKIYGEYLLARTQSLLPEHLNIPEDISQLVQAVYDDDSLPDVNLDDGQRKKLKSFQDNFLNDREREREKADAFCLAAPRLKIRPERNSLIGWLDMDMNHISEEKACAEVRDTQETVEVIAGKKKGNGYGTFQSEEDLSGKIGDSETDRLLAEQTLRLPAVLSMYGRADKLIQELEQYNREHLANWQERPWLKGTLGIIFDETNHFQVMGKTLHYDNDTGLQIIGDE